MDEWATIFAPTDVTGKALPPEDLPLAIALEHRRMAHRDIWIHGLDGVPRHIEVTAFPMLGQVERHLGAIAILGEVQE